MNDKLRVSRYDFSSITQEPTRTQQGFLRVYGNITRTGVLEYADAAGVIRRELRHPDEVFKADSLASLKGAPITDGHHGMVTPENISLYNIGVTGEDITEDGEWVTAPLTIQRKDSIAEVMSKDKSELSAGYTCAIDFTPGSFRGDSYDVKQIDITYNHVAIGPKNWARSGTDAVIKMDSKDETAAVSGIAIRTDVPQEKKEMSNKEISLRLDGVEYKAEIAEPLAANFTQSIEKMREDGVTATTRVSTLEGELAAEKKAHGELKEKFDAKTAPEAIEAAVNEHIALVMDAKKIAPEIKCDGLSARDVKITALKEVSWDAEHFDGKDDAYVNGVFAAAIKNPVTEKKIVLPSAEEKADGKDKEVKLDSKAARAKMMKEYSTAWEKGLEV